MAQHQITNNEIENITKKLFAIICEKDLFGKTEGNLTQRAKAAKKRDEKNFIINAAEVLNSISGEQMLDAFFPTLVEIINKKTNHHRAEKILDSLRLMMKDKNLYEPISEHILLVFQSRDYLKHSLHAFQGINDRDKLRTDITCIAIDAKNDSIKKKRKIA
jgi:hypothetical protein